MLRSVDDLIGYELAAEDGEIGHCRDFLFDDLPWAVRYMVADTGKWLPGRKVLISPIALGEPIARTRLFPVKLTRQQIENSPSLAHDAPISRQFEASLFDHYGWTYYWEMAPYHQKLYLKEQEESSGGEKPEKTHLRSATEVRGYHIQAINGEIGQVEDLIAEEEGWVLRYIVVNTRPWLPGGQVLVAPDWVKEVDWNEQKVSADLTREAVKNSPEYDPSEPVNREYEVRLYDYYGRPQYWK